MTKILALPFRLFVLAGNGFQPVFLLLVRFYWGWQFFETGKGKLQHIPRTANYFSDLGIPMPTFNAYFVGGLECFGGLLLLAGLLSRPVALLLTGNMVVAYLTAHSNEFKQVWSDPEAFYTAAPFTFLMASLILFSFGPGLFSIDAIFKKVFPK